MLLFETVFKFRGRNVNKVGGCKESLSLRLRAHITGAGQGARSKEQRDIKHKMLFADIIPTDQMKAILTLQTPTRHTTSTIGRRSMINAPTVGVSHSQ